MPLNVQIQCINKTNRHDPHQRISHVGGMNADGRRWKLTEDDAIAGITAGKWQFWVAGGGKSVWVVIATHAGRRYLKTEADGIHPNNLLALPECP